MNSTSRKRSTRLHRRNSNTLKVPYGYCYCGCGNKTRLAEQSCAEYEWVAGEPKRYLARHYRHSRYAVSRIVIIRGKRYRTVPLTQGLEAIVSICDYRRVSNRAWHAHRERGRIYACSRINDKIVRMHRLICGFPTTDVDHKNRNGLHNYRSNLRVVNRSKNNANGKKRKGGTSRFKWVCWLQNIRRWWVQMKINGVHYHLGYFKCEEEAARAADNHARKHFGRYARFNFPRKGEQGI